MGSHVRAWSSGQPWRVWSMWGWAAARLGTDWTARFFQGDEETLVLTQRDELNRTYVEDNMLPLNTVTPVSMANSKDTRSTTASATEDKHVLVRMHELGIGDSGATRTSTREKDPGLVHLEKLTATTVEDRPSPGEDRFTSIFDQENPPSKEAVTDGTFNGPGTSTTSSAVFLQDPTGLDETKSYREGTPTSAEVHPMQRRGCSLTHKDKAMPDRNQTNKKKISYRRAREVREKWYQTPSEVDRDHTENKKAAVRSSRTSQETPHSLAPRLASREERAAKKGEMEERGLEGSSILSTDPHKEGLPRCAWRPDSEASAIPILSTWEAGWNVTNAIQGIFVLGLPYALVHSGYVGLLLLVLSAWICNHTGQLLVSCLYEEEYSVGSGPVSRVRVRHSYQDIAEACCQALCPKWAGLGGWVVNVAQIIELLMTCTLYLLVSNSLLWDSLSGMAVPRSVCSLLTLVCVLPCLLLTDLRPVSTLSLLCSLAHIVISVLVMLYCVSQASRWSLSCLSVSVDFVVSVGVIVFSYTSQIFLPPIEASMADSGQFTSMLQWTHTAACVMKTTFALLAVLTWGQGTGEVITDNLPSDLRPLVNLCLLAKALLSYPLPFYSAAEILHTCLLTGPSVPSHPTHIGGAVSYAGLVLRGALLVTSFLMALMVPHFSLLMGLTGSVTGAAMALILPCLFHLQLRWSRLTSKDKVKDVAILSLGLSCSVSGLICSVKRLLEGL